MSARTALAWLLLTALGAAGGVLAGQAIASGVL